MISVVGFCCHASRGGGRQELIDTCTARDGRRSFGRHRVISASRARTKRASACVARAYLPFLLIRWPLLTRTHKQHTLVCFVHISMLLLYHSCSDTDGEEKRMLGKIVDRKKNSVQYALLLLLRQDKLSKTNPYMCK